MVSTGKNFKTIEAIPFVDCAIESTLCFAGDSGSIGPGFLNFLIALDDWSAHIRSMLFRSFCLILICCGPVFSQSISGHTDAAFGRLKLKLPGSWQTKMTDKALLMESRDYTNTGLIITSPSDMRTWDVSGYLASGIQGMQKSENRTVVKVFPESIVQGFTKNGTGFAFQSRITKNTSNRFRYSAYYAFSTGARYQAVILMTDTAEKLSAVMKLLTSSFDSVGVKLPEKRISTYTDAEYKFFNFSWKQPATWKRKESPYTNLTVFEPRNLPGSKYTFGISNPFHVEVELQPARAVSPVAAIQSFLTKRSTHQYRSWRNNKDALKVAAITEVQLPDGRILTGLALQQTNDDRYYLGGWLLNGPGYSVIVSAGFKLHRYDLIKRGSTAQTEHKAFYNFFNSELPRIAASVKWISGARRNTGAEQSLLNRKFFSYRRESVISGSSISVFSSNKIDWQFFSDRRAKYKIDKFTSFNDYEYNPATGTNDVSSGYLTANQDDPHSRFEVWDSSTGTYIILKRPGGVATFHALTLSPAFTIDGYRNGCCR